MENSSGAGEFLKGFFVYLGFEVTRQPRATKWQRKLDATKRDAIRDAQSAVHQ